MNPMMCYEHGHPILYYGRCEWCVIALQKQLNLEYHTVHYYNDRGKMLCDYTLYDSEENIVEKGTFQVGS